MEGFLVYFWETECRQYVKIGHSQGNLYQRRKTIQTGCPIPICEAPSTILCKDKQEMLKTERAVQKQFKAYRTSGEWFRLTPEISAYIQEFVECGLDILEADKEKHYKRNKNPKHREYYRKYQRERYHNNPEYREAQRKYHQEYHRERHQNDPEYREVNRKRSQEYRARKKQERQPISGQQLELAFEVSTAEVHHV